MKLAVHANPNEMLRPWADSAVLLEYLRRAGMRGSAAETRLLSLDARLHAMAIHGMLSTFLSGSVLPMARRDHRTASIVEGIALAHAQWSRGHAVPAGIVRLVRGQAVEAMGPHGPRDASLVDISSAVHASLERDYYPETLDRAHVAQSEQQPASARSLRADMLNNLLQSIADIEARPQRVVDISGLEGDNIVAFRRPAPAGKGGR